MKPTRDEILAEPAGPRLNQWVAEYVTHWQPSGLARDMNGNPFPEPIPDYSGEIAASWEVVEKCRDMDIPYDSTVFDYSPWFCIESPNPSIPNKCAHQTNWVAGWRNNAMYEGDGWQMQEIGETAPLAICRAALLAVVA